MMNHITRGYSSDTPSVARTVSKGKDDLPSGKLQNLDELFLQKTNFGPPINES